MKDEQFTGRYFDGWVSARYMISLPTIRRETSLFIYGFKYIWPEHLVISIYINGELVEQSEIDAGNFTVHAKIKPVMKGVLEIVSSSSFVPKAAGLNNDTRKLSFQLEDIVIPGLPDPVEPYNHLFGFTPRDAIVFKDRNTWDRISFAASDNYKVPDKEMLQQLNNGLWLSKEGALVCSVGGAVYHKFTAERLTEGKVQLFDKDKLIREMVIGSEGKYRFNDLPHGEYRIVGKSREYSDQEIRFAADGMPKVIHIPMLPIC
ncbi:hypothetical protein [Paenibacillus alkalitolerans]|uniref:hypothetical protein n=1 Tax=Paenibacillus alkalitolerans TaxID=2799335 RepID=UPI0018F5DC45|nr:hypothetical protein [Paenibacillus alkalitolerans]